MNENLDHVLGNEKEWRGYMLKKIDTIEMKVNELNSSMSALKAKVAVVSGIIGTVASLLVEYFKKGHS